MDRKGQASGALALLVVIGLGMLIALMMWGIPRYRVYARERHGYAMLQEATWTRRIDSVRAYNDVAVARQLAIRDSIRGAGVAAETRAASAGLGGPEGYLQYLWIQKLDSATVIYVPTEGNVPLFEIARLSNPNQPGAP